MNIATCRALLLVLPCLAACGGGGDGGGGPPTYTFDARIYESLSGTVTNDGTVRHDLWSAGDLSDNTTRRAFYTWIVDDLPPGARVESAVFTTDFYLEVGVAFTELGDVIVDHVDAGPTLDPVDYSHVQYTLDIGTLCTGGEYGVRSLDVTGAVRADVQAGRGITTLRLRHRSQTNVDGQRDYTAYSDPALPEIHRRASLIVTYTLP